MNRIIQNYNNSKHHKEQIEVTLSKLNSLRSQIIELRVKFEKLKFETEKRNKKICEKCKKEIRKDEKVTFKNTSKKITNHFHKSCFEILVACLN